MACFCRVRAIRFLALLPGLTLAVWLIAATAAVATAQDQGPDPSRPLPGNPDDDDRQSLLERLDREIGEIAERARQSVVKITAFTRLPMPHPEVVPEGQPAEVIIPVTYSGLVVRADGYIVTVADAVERADEFHVDLPDGRTVKGRVWATDTRTNLAVLHVNLGDGDDLIPARLADAGSGRDLRPGHFLMTCGNPFGLTRSVSTGIVTGVDRTIVIDDQPYFGVIQTNATINPGDPGGAAVGADGTVVGMIWSTYGRSRFGPAAGDPRDGMGGGMPPGMEMSQEDVEALRNALREMFGLSDGNRRDDNDGPDGDGNGDGADPDGQPRDPGPDLQQAREEWERRWKRWQNEYYRQMAQQREREVFLSAQGINFVLPAGLVKHVATELIEHKRVPRGTLGVLLKEIPTRDGRSFVVVIGVTGGSPAETVGISRGDVLIELDGQGITSMADVQRVMQTARVGATLRIHISRHGKSIDVETVLAERRDD